MCDIGFDAAPLNSAAEIPVFHIVSGDSTSSFSTISKAFKTAGLDFETVSVRVWLQRLSEAAEAGSEHPCLKMLDLWRSTVSWRRDVSAFHRLKTCCSMVRRNVVRNRCSRQSAQSNIATH